MGSEVTTVDHRVRSERREVEGYPGGEITTAEEESG